MSAGAIFCQLVKVDEARRLIFGRAVEEVVDKSDEIFDYATSKPYFEKWSAEVSKDSGGKSLGNLRAMHGNVAAGKITQMKFHDRDKAVDVTCKVVDDGEWNKVLEGVYTGFSIGGKYVKRWDDPDLEGITRYTAQPGELSLVDRPCVPTSKFFEVMKKDGTMGKRAFVQPKEGATKSAGPVIKNRSDLADAIRTFGKSADPDSVMAHIKKRASELGAMDMLPDAWKAEGGFKDKGKEESKAGASAEQTKGEQKVSDNQKDKPNAKKAADADGGAGEAQGGSETSTEDEDDATPKGAKKAEGATESSTADEDDATPKGAKKEAKKVADTTGVEGEQGDGAAEQTAQERNKASEEARQGEEGTAKVAKTEPDTVDVVGTAEDVALFGKLLNAAKLPVNKASEMVINALEVQKMVVPEGSEGANEGLAQLVHAVSKMNVEPAEGQELSAPLELLSTCIKVLRHALKATVDSINITDDSKDAVALMSSTLTKSIGEKPPTMVDLVVTLIKAGARHSKTDFEKVQAIHDAATGLGADCSAEHGKAAGGGNLAKFEDLAKSLDTALARIKKLEDQPMPTRVVLRAIGKGEDLDQGGPRDGSKETAPVKDPKTGEVDVTATAIKKAHQQGKSLIKFQLGS